MYYKIEKGDEYLCLGDFKMDDGTVDYIEGKIYLAEFDDCLTDEEKEEHHYMNELPDFHQFFKKVN